MTREEALKIFQESRICPNIILANDESTQKYNAENMEAFNLAMQALTEPEIIGCKDCEYSDDKISDGRYWCRSLNSYMYYCSNAARKTSE